MRVSIGLSQSAPPQSRVFRKGLLHLALTPLSGADIGDGGGCGFVSRVGTTSPPVFSGIGEGAARWQTGSGCVGTKTRLSRKSFRGRRSNSYFSFLISNRRIPCMESLQQCSHTEPKFCWQVGGDVCSAGAANGDHLFGV